MARKQRSEKEDNRFANERAVFDQPVQSQRGDIYKVTVQGVVVEFTNKANEAIKVYNEAAGLPKFVHKMAREGGISCFGAKYI